MQRIEQTWRIVEGRTRGLNHPKPRAVRSRQAAHLN
jgi:hypothetical protein